MRNIIIAIIALTLTPNMTNANPPMGPVAAVEVPVEVGPTQAALDRDNWERNAPTHRDFGPYGMVPSEDQPKVAGLLSGNTVRWCPSAKSNTGFAVCKKHTEGLKERMARRQKAAARPSVLWAVSETGQAYGKTFADFGKGLLKNIKGE